MLLDDLKAIAEPTVGNENTSNNGNENISYDAPKNIEHFNHEEPENIESECQSLKHVCNLFVKISYFQLIFIILIQYMPYTIYNTDLH